MVMIMIVIVRVVDIDANRLDVLDPRVTDVAVPCLGIATIAVLETPGGRRHKADRDEQRCNSDHPPG